MLSELCFSCDESLLFSLKADAAFETAECMINGLCCGLREDVMTLTDVEVAWLTPAITYILSSTVSKNNDAFKKAVEIVNNRLVPNKEMSMCGFECLVALVSNDSVQEYHEPSSTLMERQILEMAKSSHEQKKLVMDILWNACKEHPTVLLCRLVITAIQTFRTDFGNLEEIIRGIYPIKGNEKDFETFVYYALDFLLKNKSDTHYVVHVFNILWDVVPKDKLLRLFVKVMNDAKPRGLVSDTHCEALIPIFAKFIFSEDNFKRCFPEIVSLFIDSQDEKWNSTFYNFIFSHLNDAAAVAIFFRDLNRLYVTRPIEMRNVIYALAQKDATVYDENSLLFLANINTALGVKVNIDAHGGPISPMTILLNSSNESQNLNTVQQLQIFFMKVMCNPDDFDRISVNLSIDSEEKALLFIELCAKVKMSRGTRKRLRLSTNISPDLAEIVRLSADLYPMNELKQVGPLPDDAVCYKTPDFLFVFSKNDAKNLSLQIRSMIGVKDFELVIDDSLKEMPTSSLAPAMVVNLGMALPDNKCKLQKLDVLDKPAVNLLDQTYIRIDFKVFVADVGVDSTTVFNKGTVSPAFAQFYADLGFSQTKRGVQQTETHFVRLLFETMEDKQPGDVDGYGVALIFNESRRPINMKKLDIRPELLYAVSYVDELYVITPLVVPEPFLSWPLGQGLVVHREHLKYAILSLLYFPTIVKIKTPILSKYQARGVIWRELDKKRDDDVFRIIAG